MDFVHDPLFVIFAQYIYHIVSLAKDFINKTDSAIFRFPDYQYGNSQKCFTNETNDDMKALSEFIKEPFAWLLGQSFKYLLNKTKHFDTLLSSAVSNLKIDFNFPIVGYLYFFKAYAVFFCF